MAVPPTKTHQEVAFDRGHVGFGGLLIVSRKTCVQLVSSSCIAQIQPSTFLVKLSKYLLFQSVAHIDQRH